MGEAQRDKPLCFVIGPFGAPASATRKWSDFLFRKIIEPAARNAYAPARSIDDPEPGAITDRVLRDLETADLVIADLTDHNANTFYELGLRHALGKPFLAVCRSDTTVPFDVSTLNVLKLDGYFVEQMNDYAMADEKVDDAKKTLRDLIEKVRRRPSPVESRATLSAYSARVYDWTTQYSPEIASAWLERQETEIRDVVHRYEGGGGDDVPDKFVRTFAEYLELKGSANQQYRGRLFYVLNNQTRQIEFGFAMYQFPNSPPLVIEVFGEHPDDDTAEITFEQRGRQVSVGKIVTQIRGYTYAVTFKKTARGGILAGTILHPDTQTVIGEARLTSRYGFR